MSPDPAPETAPRPRGRVSPLPPRARPFQGRRAGLVTRSAAALLDGVVVASVLAAGYLGATLVVFLVDPRGFTTPRPGVFFSLTAGFAVAFAYLTVAWAAAGRSYGQLVMGLRVVRASGRPVRLPGAAARALLVVLFPIGIVWVPLGRGNRAVHDVLLGTVVVYDWTPRGAPIAPRAARGEG